MRLLHGGDESPLEEQLIEDMTTEWEKLSEAEQAAIRAEGPKTMLPCDAPRRIRTRPLVIRAICDNCGAEGTLEAPACDCRERFGRDENLALEYLERAGKSSPAS